MTQDMAKMADKELFGTPSQISMMERGRALWALVCDDPAYSFFGRSVSLCGMTDDAFERIAALARLQGGTACHFFPKSELEAMTRELEDVGLGTNTHDHMRGTEPAYDAAKALISEMNLPNDITLGVVDMATPGEIVKDIAEVSLACGVVPVPGDAMRGHVRDGLCLAALDGAGTVVATASSYMNNHPEGARATDAFWGMLATRQDRRGERIGLYLGALAIVQMWENHGARAFNAGIAQVNEPSVSLCDTLKLAATEWTFLSCVDPELYGTDSAAK
ncbi:MAG: hypothetical protein AB8B94_12250 [Hyphomicrobiales bacterium]